MLEKKRRLTKKKDFMKLAVKGRSVFGPYATLRFRQVSFPEAKIAFITSTKVFKKSVDRNRVKRRMREAVRSIITEIPEGLHLLFILKPEAKAAKYELLIQEIKRLISKIPDALTKPAKPSSRGVKFMGKNKTQLKP